MYVYGFFLAVVFVIWLWCAIVFPEDAFITKNPKDIKKAKRTLLSFFLIPVYPLVLVGIAFVGPFVLYKKLDKLNKRNEDTVT